jgi:hypothetical protein
VTERVNWKHPGYRGKQCCQIPVFIVKTDCVLCEVRDKKKGKGAEFWAYDTTEYSDCKVRAEAEEILIIKSIYRVRHGKKTFCSVTYILKTSVSRDAHCIIKVADPDGGILTDEIYSCFTQRIKQGLTKESVKQGVHILVAFHMRRKWLIMLQFLFANTVGPAFCILCRVSIKYSAMKKLS